ncbi:MAG: SDR family oxidoreductase [Rhodobacteraceae bacterium]|nr:SDR family oxidoreductase [Paracoccaceae bacterium]
MADKQIIVTGASKGIGAAIAMDLDRRGFHVACLSRSGVAPVGTGYACDMTDEAAVRATIATCADAGDIIGLVNNAGMHIPGSIATLDIGDYERVMALNATSVMVAAREVYPYLKDAGGTIVNIGSFFDRMGVPDNLAYCASKAAVAAMTRCMAVEWADDGIRAVNIAPGYVETDLNREFLTRPKVAKWMAGRIAVGKPAQPDEIARLVGAIFAENINSLTGETIYVDGAQGINH